MLKKIAKLLLKWSFIYLPLIYSISTLTRHTGYKEGYRSYFLEAALISILLVTFTTKTFETHFKRSIIGLGLIVLATELFWDYMDHPWFAGPETNTCDGPCFEWFSFENPSPSFMIAFLGAFFTFITGAIKAFVLGNNKVLTKFISNFRKYINI